MQTGGGIPSASPAFECRFFLFAQLNGNGCSSHGMTLNKETTIG
jgi:hypothetical protein